MLDAASSLHQRAKGRAQVVLGARGQVVDLFQKGSAKAILPRVHLDVPEVVFLNTSGGLTGGDRLSFDLEIAAGTTAMAATQTAERAYASSGGTAEVDVNISVGDDAFCLWMPQETILFDRAALARETIVRLGRRAQFLGVETIVLGRAAMREVVQTLDLSDVRRVLSHSGTPVHAEHVAVTTRTLKRRENRAGLAGHTVFASLVYIGADACDQLDTVRRLAQKPAVVSAFGHRLVVRIEGDDSWSIRQILIPIIKALGEGNIPRVWQS